ncbi:MAG: efflux RND transporter periplasmic adaptor subunit [Kouleothrix sp.]|nr:efflux RND transporter periplasmic adaptor subunit [Kouleothrix sp.]
MTDVPRGRRLPRRRTVLTVAALLLIVGAVGLGVYLWRGSSAAPGRAFSLIYPRRDTLIATVNATGQLEPAQVASLSFAAAGRVEAVLARVGETVARGAPLARLDTRDLDLRVAQAQAALAQAQASYDRVAAGSTPAEVAAAEAQVQQAGGQLRQAQGSVTSADLQAAEAQLAQAEAQLARLESGPQTSDLQTAEAQLAQAQANLLTQRNQLSAAKTTAQLQVDQSTSSLTQAQARYAAALQNWQYVQETGNDPITPRVPDSANPGKTKPNRLGEAQRQQYYTTFVQAEAALRGAEGAVQQALVAAENARQAEVSSIQAVEQQVAIAQAGLDKLRAGAEADQLAAARAQLASARANLNKLRGEQRGGALQAAQAGVDQAQANLERLRSGPQPSDLAVARAQVQSAEATLGLARLALEQATLTAPFAGVVAQVNLQAGETPSPTKAPVVLADLSSYHVDVTVDEIDVSRLAAGQPVTLTLDALPGLALPGLVETISPLASPTTAVTSYQVRVTTTAQDSRLRSGMSANADIVVARRPGVLVAPRRAVRNDRGRLVADLPKDPSICLLPVERRPATVELEQREVTTGLSNEQLIEITAGLDEQTCVYVEGIDARLNILFGPPPGLRGRN